MYLSFEINWRWWWWWWWWWLLLSRKIVWSCGITATSRKTEPSIICILLYSILSSGRITGESKLCCFPKIRANILEHKQFKDMAFTGYISWCLSKSFLSPLRINWTSKRSWIKINARRNLARFYKVSFARSWVSSGNWRPFCCNRLKKTAVDNSIYPLHYTSTYFEHTHKKYPRTSSL